MVSRAIRLFHDYEKCIEINDSLNKRIDYFKAYYLSAERTIEKADSLNIVCSNTVEAQAKENHKLERKYERAKKAGKLWMIPGAIVGAAIMRISLIFF